MTLNNLLNNATLIKTAIQPMNHNIPVILERKKMYLQAVAKYNYYPLQDEKSTSTELSSSKIFTQSLDGLEYGEAVLAIQPIPYLLDGDDLIQAFDKLSENLAQYIDTHRQIFAKAEKNGYIPFHNIEVHEPDFELRTNGHVLEHQNIIHFFSQVGLKQHLLKPQKLRNDINTDPNIFYIKIDEDNDHLAVKVIFKPIENKDDPEYVVQNVELVVIQDCRDEVLKSISQPILEDLNQNFECAVEEFDALIRIINLRNGIAFKDADLPF